MQTIRPSGRGFYDEPRMPDLRDASNLRLLWSPTSLARAAAAGGARVAAADELDASPPGRPIRPEP